MSRYTDTTIPCVWCGCNRQDHQDLAAARARLGEVERERDGYLDHSQLVEAERDEILKSRVYRSRPEGVYLVRCENCDALAARVEGLERALVTVMLPIEALHASVTWELAPPIKAAIAAAVIAGRAALTRGVVGVP